MNTKQMIFSFTLSAAIVLGAVGVAAGSAHSYATASNTHTLTLNADNGAAGANAKTTNGYEIEFNTSGLTASADAYGALAKDGYVELAEGYSINNLKEFTVESSDNSKIAISYGFESGVYVREDLVGWVPVGSASELHEHPNYIRFTALADVVIESISLTYFTDGAACTTATPAPSQYKQTYRLPGTKFEGATWTPADALVFDLNSHNKNMDYAEYQATVTFENGAAFKVLNGEDWTTFNALTIDQSEGTAFHAGQVKYNGYDRDLTVAAPGEYTIYVKHNAQGATLYIPETENEIPEVATYDVFCYAPESLTAVYMHAWSSFGEATTWPGNPMTKVSGNLWKISVPEDKYEYCLFHNNEGIQGPNTTLPAKDSDNKFYCYNEGIWATDNVKPTYIDTATSISEYGSTFGCWQYGGVDGTTTAHNLVTDTNVSKETDGGALKVSVNGTGSTASRIYSSYFKLNDQRTAANAGSSFAVSFWVYNTVQGGGLLFKANGTEVTDTLKFDIFNANNEILKEDNRDLNYTGFRRYQIVLDADITAWELEIGIWGASLNTAIYLSRFQFVQLEAK